MKGTLVFGVVLLLVPLFGVLGIAQVSSSASASASSDGPMEVTIGTFNFAAGDSLALEIVRDEPCTCMCDPISVTGFHLRNAEGPVPVKLLSDPVLPLPIEKWVWMLSLVSPDGSPLPAGQYTAVVETSAGTFTARISVAEPGMTVSSWGRVSSSASICGVEIRLYRLLTKDTAASINLHIGDRLMVALAGNATTGYEWQQVASEEEAILSPLAGLDYLPDSAPAGTVGSGGTFLFRFSADRAGTMDLTFTYRRPWEEGPGADTVTFHVTVN
ncbi:MAG: hypothetical protein GWP12_02340 [Nitrospirae bacterium]|nr:hypothetical protein [Nitrospirota bacterium]